ncbi:MAG: hypothetical protein QM776_01505 [Rhodocyclaceae bacterium]
MPAAPLITDELAAFIHKGVSLAAASRDANLQPSMARAYGCHISPDRRRVTLILSQKQSAALLADITASGQIALAITEPSTHRTYQLKGSDAAIVPLRPFDHASCDSHLTAFIREVMPLGFTESLLRAVMDTPIDDRVAVSFTPSDAFSQTPGASAGARLA